MRFLIVERNSRESIWYFHMKTACENIQKMTNNFFEHIGEHFCTNKQMSSFSVFYYKKGKKCVSNMWKKGTIPKKYIEDMWILQVIANKISFPEMNCFCSNFRENVRFRENICFLTSIKCTFSHFHGLFPT
jgi:hypothetical protein